MPPLPSDDDLLLEFADASDETIAEVRAELAKFGDAFRYQLIAARHLEHQAAHLEELRAGDQLGDTERLEHMAGYVEALRHTAESLRIGEYLPGGHSFDDTLEAQAF